MRARALALQADVPTVGGEDWEVAMADGVDIEEFGADESIEHGGGDIEVRPRAGARWRALRAAPRRGRLRGAARRAWTPVVPDDRPTMPACRC